MIIYNNIITLSKYFINRNEYLIEFENFDSNDDMNDDDLICNCNICYTFRNIILFILVPLKSKKI
jgi:hypothetical protein